MFVILRDWQVVCQCPLLKQCRWNLDIFSWQTYLRETQWFPFFPVKKRTRTWVLEMPRYRSLDHKLRGAFPELGLIHVCTWDISSSLCTVSSVVEQTLDPRFAQGNCRIKLRWLRVCAGRIQPMCMYVRLSVFLPSVSLSVQLLACLPIYARIPVCLSNCLSVSLVDVLLPATYRSTKQLQCC